MEMDDRFATTMSGSVMTIHDATRQFCKVVSMAYNEIEIGEKELVCGKIALKV